MLTAQGRKLVWARHSEGAQRSKNLPDIEGMGIFRFAQHDNKVHSGKSVRKTWANAKTVNTNNPAERKASVRPS